MITFREFVNFTLKAYYTFMTLPVMLYINISRNLEVKMSFEVHYYLET